MDIEEKLEIEILIKETEELYEAEGIIEAAVKTAGWNKDSVKKFGKTIGKSPKEHGFFDACTLKMKGKVKDPEGLCASLIDTYKGTTEWRGKKK